MRIKVSTSEIEYLVEELNKLGHEVHGNEVDIKEVIAGILELGQKNPDEIKKDALDELNNTERFLQHGEGLYPDNVGTHQERLGNVGNFCRDTLSLWNSSQTRTKLASDPSSQDFYGELDIDYLTFYFENHDIPEGILKAIGDVSTTIKKRLTPEASNILARVEILGLDTIGHEGFGVSENMYQQLRKDTEEKTSIEAHIGSFLDKSDGLCACLLEVYKGNASRIHPLREYIKIFQSLRKKPIAQLIKALSQYSKKRKKTGSNKVSSLFNLDHILSLTGGNIFPNTDEGDKQLDEYLRQKFLGRGKNYLFQELNEDALEMTTDLDIPLFFQTWLECQSIGIFQGPAKALRNQR